MKPASSGGADVPHGDRRGTTTRRLTHYARRVRELGPAGTLKRVLWKMARLPRVGSVVDRGSAGGWDRIDVRVLMRDRSVKDHATNAERYWQRHLDDVDRYHAKPFSDVNEAPDHLVCLAQLIRGLRLLPGMRVLDFGAGTGWSTRYLAQLGCEAIACDVSPTALRVAQELMERLPVMGSRPAPSFLVFDGHRLDLADGSVDRVLSFDAFHHVPNPAEVLRELGRVLKPGGIAGFSEPGPEHSMTAESQSEMRNFGVIENDMVLDEIWGWAREAGFTSLEVAVFDSRSFRLSLPGFHEFLEGGPARRRYLHHVVEFVRDRRIFFLLKGEPERADSRVKDGLDGRLEVWVHGVRVSAGQPIPGVCRARNVGRNVWLPSDAPYGPVWLGVHLYEEGRLVDRDYTHVPLPAHDGIRPGQEVEIPFSLPALPEGDYRLEFDLVSEHVCWFEVNGRAPVPVDVSVG